MAKVANKPESTAQIATAKQKFVIMSHRKLRRVANEIRGKGVVEAYHMLKFMPYRAATMLLKKLVEASNNAEQKFGADASNLVVRSVLIDEGPAYRRFKPRAQGRIYRREKPTAHITLNVEVINQ